MVAWVIAGATGLGDRRGLRTVTVEPIKNSEEYLYYSELLEVCIVDPICIHFEFFSETGGAEGKLLISEETGDESRTTSVSEKNLLVTGFIRSLQYTVSSGVFESEVSISVFEIIQLDFSFIFC